MNLSNLLVRSTIVAALGGLLFGFDTAVIAGITGALTRVYGLSAGGLGLTVASALWGTIVGAALASIPGEKFGRRDSLRVMAILYFVSAAGSALAWNWDALVFFRFVGGLGIGGSSVLGPMYIAEIAPAKFRGRLVGFFQFNVVAGILLALFPTTVSAWPASAISNGAGNSASPPSPLSCSSPCFSPSRAARAGLSPRTAPATRDKSSSRSARKTSKPSSSKW